MPSIGHLTTGRDAKGRKQYRYHSGAGGGVPGRDEVRAGCRLRTGVPPAPQRPGGTWAAPASRGDKVLAAVIRLLETTLIRVGNDEYATTSSTV